MSGLVPNHRPGTVRLSDPPAEQQAQHAQRNAMGRPLKNKRKGSIDSEFAAGRSASR